MVSASGHVACLIEAVGAACARIEAGDPAIWISRVARDVAEARAEESARRGADLPLAGLTFAVKDNIDVAGMPTTAGCPDFAYTPAESATAVARLEAAGAVLLGKTNLDQFATGLVGTRSPYGVPRSPIDDRLVPGGSSSGSAVAVARGMVSFALGTDTAGSGRVPAAFTETVGCKPTRGLISNHGVFPACRSLDCVSIFGPSVGRARAVLGVLAAPDTRDPYSRTFPITARPWSSDSPVLRIGVPGAAGLCFFGNDSYRRAFQTAVQGVAHIGWTPIAIDYAPLREAAQLLYSGPWVAERLVALTPFIDEHPESMLPVTRQIIACGREYSAADCFRAAYRLEELRVLCDAVWEEVDLVMVPTAGTIYTLDEVAADPLATNTNLGYYTNFVNLLDLCAVAVPCARTTGGLPFGVTLIARAGADGELLSAAERLMPALGPARPEVYASSSASSTGAD